MVWPNKGLSHRPLAVSRRGVVASAHQLASLAGVRMLLDGGNAVDAAVAVAAALNVCEPYMSGMAGVGYMSIFDHVTRSVDVLNYNGVAPMEATPDRFRNRAEQEHGPKSAMVPGACAGWLTALKERGTLTPAQVFASAIEYAEVGIPLTQKNEWFYRNSIRGGHLDANCRAVFFPGGIVPPASTIIRQPLLAETMRMVVADGIDTFYRGAIAREIVHAARSQGGLLSQADLDTYVPFWEKPTSVSYRNYAVHSAPPPCAGIQYLQTLKLVEPFDLRSMGQNSSETIHLVAEAMKLAVADRIRYAPLAEACPVDELLSDDYLDARRDQIDLSRPAMSEGDRFDGHFATVATIAAGVVRTPLKVPESTTSFSVIDGQGNGVVVTQSLGDGFGSGVMAGSTGLMLNNFNYWFDSDPDSPNVIGPGKRIEMCMAPAIVTHSDGSLFSVIGTPGSFGIMQTTPQMIMNIVDHQYSIQAAIEAPRFRTYEAATLEMEARIPKLVRDDLVRIGHTVRLIDDWSFLVGGGHGVMIDPDSGAMLGGADPRRDGVALGI